MTTHLTNGLSLMRCGKFLQNENALQTICSCAACCYPTAKKRHLPRIQKVTERIGGVSQHIANGQWEEVKAFAVDADNAVLPM